ncbi:hypothetical protein NE237_008916 [Protea cynaroides]|uniref:Uncharacterized protein n=1 Tax=Protea cynaroides TaxID=273540 RepID=A0A9Q0KXD5_9MAGN|nr:hypothetical protein NE237_008916 [Protea cynaroides]
MTVTKRYVLRMFMSLKHITANVVDRNNGRIVATASTVEHALKNTMECGRSCNAKAAGVVGEVLAMRLKVEGLDQGQGRGIFADARKEIEKKGLKNQTKATPRLTEDKVKQCVDPKLKGEYPPKGYAKAMATTCGQYWYKFEFPAKHEHCSQGTPTTPPSEACCASN